MWFKVDDKLWHHRKARRAVRNGPPGRDPAAIGLWVLAGSWCGQLRTEGVIPAEELGKWADNPDALAKRLVEAGLWEETELDGELAYRFVNWDEFQFTAEDFEAKREAGRRGGQARAKALAKASAVAPAKAPAQAPATPEPVAPAKAPASNGSVARALADRGSTSRGDPDPTRPHRPRAQARDARVARGWDQDAIDKIVAWTGGDPSWARQVAATILDRATSKPGDPLKYVLAAIEQEPGRYLYHRGKPTQKESCQLHPGQWPDNCAGCAADRKAAGQTTTEKETEQWTDKGEPPY